jgi:hypothetical protein
MAEIKVDITGGHSGLDSALNEAKKGVEDAARKIVGEGKKIDDMFDGIGESANRSLRDLKKELKDLEKGLKECNEAASKIGQNGTIDEYTKKIEKARETIENLKKHGATSDGINGFSAQLRQVEENLEKYQQKLEDAKRTEQRILNDKANYEQEIHRVQEAIDNYGKTTEKSTKATTELGDAQKKAAKDAKEMSEGQKIATQATGGLKDMMGTIAKLSGGYLTVKGIEKFISKTIEAREELELMQIQFEGLMGEEGAGIFGQIKDMAMESGVYSTKSLADAAQQLNLYGVEAENIIPMMKQFEDVAMGNERTIQQLAISFGRLESQGNLTNISLRSMLRTGFNPLAEISRTTGKSMTQLNAELKAGQISVDQVKEALKSATSEGGKFYQMNERVSESLKAEKERLGMMYTKMFVEIGEGFDGAIKGSLRFAQAVVGHYKEILGLLTTMIATYGAYRTTVIATAAAEAALNAHYVTKIRLLRAAVIAQRALNAAMMLNPYGLAAAAIVGLTTSIIVFSKASRTAEGEMERVKDRAKEQADELENLRGEISKNIDAINDDTKSEGERTEALDNLKRILPSVFEKYENWISLQRDLANATAAANQQLAIQNNVVLGQNIQHDRQMLEDLKKYRETLKHFFNGDEERAARLNLIKKYPELFGIDKNSEAFQKKPEIFLNVAFKDKGTFETDWHFVNGKILEVTKSVNGLNEQLAAGTGKMWSDTLPNKNLTETNKELKEMEDALKRLKAQQNPLELTKRWKQQNKGKFELGPNSDNMEQMKLEMSTVIVNGEELTEKEITRRIKALRGHASTVVKNEGKDFLKDAKAAYEAAQKGVQKVIKDRNKKDENGVRIYGTEQAYQAALKAAKDKEKQAEIAYKQLGGDPKKDKSDLKNAQRTANEEAQFREKTAEEQKAWAQKQVKQAYDAAKARMDAQVAGMEEGFEKTMLTIENGYKQEQDKIDQKEAELRKENYEHAKKLYDADPKNKSKAFSDTHDIMDEEFNLTVTQQAEVDALREASEKKFRKEVNDTFEAQMQNFTDYIKGYGSLQAQRLAIQKDYNRRIEKEQDYWVKKQLEKERDAALETLTSENLLRQIDLGMVFADYGKALAGPLEETVKQLQKYTTTDAFKARSFEDQRSIYEAIQKAQQQLGGFGGMNLGSVGESLYDYNNSVVAFNVASKEYEEATKRLIEAEEAHADAEKKVKTATDEAARNFAQASLNIAQGNLNTAKGNYNNAEKNYQNAQSDMAEKQQIATASLQRFQQSIDNVGNVAKAVASGSMKQLWTALGTKTQVRIGEFISGTHSFNKGIAEITKTLASQDKGLDYLVEKVQGVVEDVIASGDKLEQSGLGGKISQLFESIFGKSNDVGSVTDKVVNAINNAIAGSSEDNGEEDKSGDKTKKAIKDAITEALNGSGGSLWSMIVGLVLDLLDVLEQGLGNLVDGLLTKVGDAISGILSEIGSGRFFVNIAHGVGSVIGGIVKGIGNLFTGGWAFGGGNVDEMEEEIAELARQNEALAKSIDSLAESIDKSDSTNQQSLEAYRKALDAEKEWEENQRKAIDNRASEWSNSGHGFLGLGGKHSFNAYLNDNGTDWWVWEAFNKVLKENGYDKTINSAGQLWELSPEMMKLLRDYSPKAWAAVLNTDGESNPSELLDEYIARAGEIEKLTSSLNEKLTGYTWDGFLDSYKSLLKDLTSETVNFSEKIEDIISNALLESLVNEEFQEKIKALYQYISDNSGDGLDESELAYIRDENKKIAEEMIARRQALIDAGLIKVTDADEYKQEASKKGFASMSQDTGEELNGRFTALQIAGENISAQMIQAVALLSAMSSFGGNQSQAVTEIRDALMFTNTYLEDMVKYAKLTYIQFGEKIDKLIEQTKNI